MTSAWQKDSGPRGRPAGSLLRGVLPSLPRHHGVVGTDNGSVNSLKAGLSYLPVRWRRAVTQRGCRSVGVSRARPAARFMGRPPLAGRAPAAARLGGRALCCLRDWRHPDPAHPSSVVQSTNQLTVLVASECAAPWH